MIGPKTWDRVVRIFFGIFERPVTVQNISGLLGSLILEILALNHVFVWKKAGNGLLIGPKTWDRIMEIFVDFLD